MYHTANHSEEVHETKTVAITAIDDRRDVTSKDDRIDVTAVAVGKEKAIAADTS